MSASRLDQKRVADRHRRLLDMLATGATVEQVAALDATQPGAEWVAHYGGSPGRVAQDARRALERRASYDAETASRYVLLEMARLDAADRRVNAVLVQAARAGNSAVVLHAVDRVVRLSKRRSELLGLNARAETRNPAGPSPASSAGDDLAKRRAARRASARLAAAQDRASQ